MTGVQTCALPICKMRELVDREYNVLTLLIRSFQKDTSSDNSTLIFSIFSMLAMFTVSLRTFDEIYFFNNHKTLRDKDVWHLAHEKWMSVYDTLSSEWFIEKLQDYGTFETKLTTLGVDIYYISLMDQVAELKEEIEDNQGPFPRCSPPGGRTAPPPGGPAATLGRSHAPVSAGDRKSVV